MDSLQFEWDNQKAQINFKKHGFSFDEAATISEVTKDLMGLAALSQELKKSLEISAL